MSMFSFIHRTSAILRKRIKCFIFFNNNICAAYLLKFVSIAVIIGTMKVEYFIANTHIYAFYCM